MNTQPNAHVLEQPIGPQGRFQLRLVGGNVEIRGSDESVVRVEDREGKPLGDRFTIDASNGSLSLSLRDRSILGFALGGRDKDADLSITVPRLAAVGIEAVSADVTAAGLGGRGQFRTTSGDVTLEDVGGALDVGSVSGDVAIEGISTLDLRVRNVSGDIDVTAPSYLRLEIGTTSGDIDIDGLLAGAGPFSIQTVSGDCTIVGRGGLEIDARTVTGDVSSDLPHRAESRPGRRSLVVGGGGTRLSFQSVSGGLEVTEPREDLPPAVEIAAPPAAGGVGDVSSETPVHAPGSGEPSPEEVRLEILRALERGEIGIEEAAARLAAFEEA